MVTADNSKFIFLNVGQFVEADRGRFDSTLFTREGEELAHTEGDKIVAYAKDYGNKQAVKEWATWYELPIEWRD